MRTTCTIVAMLAATVMTASPVLADALLTLSVGKDSTEISREDFDKVKTVEIKTGTKWTDGIGTFKGPLARDVLALAGVDNVETITAVAANDYSIDIPVADFENYDVILATEMNGKRLTLRDKGPIWIVYPRDDHSELDDPSFNARWIWQLVELDLK